MITDRGCWEGDEYTAHLVDIPLCDAIIKTFSDIKFIIDVGCGNGGYTKYLIEHGFDCVGYDGSTLTPKITDGLCGVMDFSQPVHLGRFDLVLSLEVGEHIPAQYEQVFIDNITKMSMKYICLSWAVEGQPGWGHVNCRNNDYIISKMAERGFLYDNDKSQVLRDNSTLPWFKNTTMVFYR